MSITKWGETHTHTLINKTELLVRKALNDANVDKCGEPAELPTPEFGIQMTQTGHDAFLCNVDPLAQSNSDDTLCIVRGCHVMHAIKYMTKAEALAHIDKNWAKAPKEEV